MMMMTMMIIYFFNLFFICNAQLKIFIDNCAIEINKIINYYLLLLVKTDYVVRSRGGTICK